jgi:hypothetical protein
MPWLRNEDAALKLKLQGLRVVDGNSGPDGRTVPVRYRLPEDELANLSYPIFIIEHAGMEYDADRDHRGHIQLPYAPEGMQQWWSDDTQAAVALSPYFADFPRPWKLNYQITLYARFMTQHIMPLKAILAGEQYLNPKDAFLLVPQDGTVRSMFLLGGPQDGYGFDEDQKRIYKVTYLVTVFAELVENVQVLQSYGGTLVPASAVNLDLKVYSDVSDISLNTPAEIEANRGILSVGAASSFNAQTLPNG